MEQIAQPEHEHGWENPNPGIRISTVGYWPKSRKTAIATTTSSEFHLVDVDTGTGITGIIMWTLQNHGTPSPRA